MRRSPTNLSRILPALLLVLLLGLPTVCAAAQVDRTVTAAAASSAEVYYPGQWGDWESRDPAAMGFDVDLLAEAVEFAQANRNPSAAFNPANEPYNDIIGPTSNPTTDT